MNVQRKDKNKILNRLENSISKVISENTLSAFLLSDKKTNKFNVGKYVVIKQSNGLYQIKEQSGHVLYEGIQCVDTVFALVECLLLNNMATIRRILTFENEYCKQYSNMVYMKRAIENKYSSIYETRYELAKERLSNAQHKIRTIRKTLR